MSSNDLQLGKEAKSRVNTGQPGKDRTEERGGEINDWKCHFILSSHLQLVFGRLFMRVGQNNNQFGFGPEIHSISIWSENRLGKVLSLIQMKNNSGLK